MALGADTGAATPTRQCPPPSSAPPLAAGTATGRGCTSSSSPQEPRSWVQRLVIRSRKRELGLGSTALVSLAEARDRALSKPQVAREGGDPLAEKRRADAMPTFADAAARIVEQKRAGWRSPIHARTWLNSLERHAFPRIGGWSVSEVTSADVLEVLTPIWHVKLPDGPVRAPAHQRGDGVGHRDEPQNGQPV